MRATLTNGSAASQQGRALLGLRELVLKGDFGPGEHLFEVAVSERLGVSRTPARMALERLAQEGLIEPASGGGYQVRTFSIRDIWDAIEARGVLEGAAVRLAAERLTDARELLPAKTIQAKLEQITDTPGPRTPEQMAAFADGNSDFHRALVRLAKSPMLEWSLERFQSIPFAAPSSVLMPPSPEGALIGQYHHRQLLETIANREGARAESIAREHARFARFSLEAALAVPSETARKSGLALILGRAPVA